MRLHPHPLARVEHVRHRVAFVVTLLVVLLEVLCKGSWRVDVTWIGAYPAHGGFGFELFKSGTELIAYRIHFFRPKKQWNNATFLLTASYSVQDMFTTAKMLSLKARNSVVPATLLFHFPISISKWRNY